jgi:hypothetical protein
VPISKCLFQDSDSLGSRREIEAGVEAAFSSYSHEPLSAEEHTCVHIYVYIYILTLDRATSSDTVMNFGNGSELLDFADVC